jgi:antagonist of KipI
MTLIVRQPGIQTTVQDLGRLATQHIGVSVGGAMDEQAHCLANTLVGNDRNATALDCAFGGIALQCEVPVLMALAGRDITASLDGTPIPAWHAFRAHAGALLALHTGCRTTIAVAGGFAVPRVLNGGGTSVRAGFGGWHGRALRKEDRLPIGTPSPLSQRMSAHLAATARTTGDWSVGPALRPAYSAQPSVRVITGPEFDQLTAASRESLLRDSFRVAPESDRMGFRLAGHSLTLTAPIEMLSSGVTAGTIQLPPGGAPILLMADRQTTGGYPRLADVIAVDLPLVAQLRPGDGMQFTPVSLDLAHTLYRARAHHLARAARALQLRFDAGVNASR